MGAPLQRSQNPQQKNRREGLLVYRGVSIIRFSTLNIFEGIHLSSIRKFLKSIRAHVDHLLPAGEGTTVTLLPPRAALGRLSRCRPRTAAGFGLHTRGDGAFLGGSCRRWPRCRRWPGCRRVVRCSRRYAVTAEARRGGGGGRGWRGAWGGALRGGPRGTDRGEGGGGPSPTLNRFGNILIGFGGIRESI